MIATDMLICATENEHYIIEDELRASFKLLAPSLMTLLEYRKLTPHKPMYRHVRVVCDQKDIANFFRSFCRRLLYWFPVLDEPPKDADMDPKLRTRDGAHPSDSEGYFFLRSEIDLPTFEEDAAKLRREDEEKNEMLY